MVKLVIFVNFETFLIPFIIFDSVVKLFQGFMLSIFFVCTIEMFVRFDFCSLFFPKLPFCFLHFFCSSQFEPTPLELPQFEPSDDTDFISHLLIQHHNPFHAIEFSLHLHGISFTPFLVIKTLILLKNSSKVTLSFFHYSQFRHHHQCFQSPH